ncbi:signal transduction histidine kinase/ligand-binding sensor domain-containing protein/DNA-binding response OmpR family regulator [Lewinella marina]|uniref:histidine kinase n=1 Tax=Neolewinella marina TaxID=438751 RepID=A0A2G0CDC2_9BACT|nr:hybrid sensor histidine kinase/response regulator transcription factor [Neolewinella marina]NJB86057.1 signal transduction histidine kinase/ligand-binding sensor domain-containing protein/DNA-binding response OmpR family regulator [Neolewinella marina]PHK97978.1 hypothetical protein CGL56_12350 [Neolewinella marina]
MHNSRESGDSPRGWSGRNWRQWLLGAVAAILTVTLAAQPTATITAVPELPKQVVTALHQDQQGYLWVGTRSGLFRYDGYEAVHYVADQTDSTALINNTISSIAEGPRGRIWVTTESGISLFDPLTGVFRSFFHRNYVRKVSFDERGRAWAVIGTLGLLHFPGDAPFDSLPEAVAPIDIGFLGFADPQSVSIGFDTLDDRVILTGNATATFDRESLQLLSRGGGGERQSPTPQRMEGAPVIAAVKGKSGEEWVATAQRLYHRGRGSKAEFAAFRPGHEFFENNQLTALLADRQGCLWVGSLRGVGKITSPRGRFGHHMIAATPGGPESNQVTAIRSAGGGQPLWVTTNNGGLFAFNPAAGSFERQTFPGQLPTTTILGLRTADTALWVAASNAVVSLDLERGELLGDSLREWLRVGSYATSMVEVTDGEWWVGTWQDGLHRISAPGASASPPAFEQLTQELGRDPIFSMIRDRGNRIWIGTRGGGIKRVTLPAGPIVTYDKRRGSGLRSDGILQLYEDRNGVIWAATRGGGVARFDEENDRFLSYGRESGLPDLTVCSIGETGNGELWLSTSSGLAHHLPGELVPFWAYSSEDQFINREFSFQSVGTDGRGHLFFGNQVGITEVSSGPTAEARAFNPVRLAGFRSIGDPEEETEVLSHFPARLDHRHNGFEVAVTSLDLAAPDQIRFAYRIAGLEDDWNIGDPGIRTITYHQLPAGDYVLEVRNSDADGYWNDEPARFSFRVLSHPLLTQTALTVYAAVVLLLLVAGWLIWNNWMRLRRKLARNLATIRRQNRQMIYLSDISHEMRNRLTLILGPLERVMQGKEVDQVAVQRIYQNAVRLKQLSDRVMKMRRTEDGGFQLWVRAHAPGPFLESVFDRVHDLAQIRGIDLRRHFPEGTGEIYFDSNVLEIILLNLLNNAIKYTPEGGSVELKVGLSTEVAPKLLLSVRDSGIGIAREELQRIFDRFYRSEHANASSIEGTGIGLELVARLVNLHHGTIQLESEEGKFTEVSVALPVGRQFYASMGHLDGISPVESLVAAPTGSDREPLGTVLVVEDNAGIRELIRETLCESFQVLEAPNGQRGLELALEAQPDLILSDLHMPGLSGLELLTAVRGDARTGTTPFLILTGRTSVNLRLDALQAGVTDIIEKPFSGELLRWRIKSLVAERRKLAALTDDQPRVYTIEPSEPDDCLSADEQFLQRLNQLMEEHYASSDLSVEFLAAELSMSRPTLYRHMERLLQEAPANFIKRFRLKKAALLLQQRKFQVSEVAYMTGFNTPKYFSKCFQKEFGHTPSQYVAGLDQVAG